MELSNWNIPVLALRGLTVFPHMNLTFDVERPISIAALERAMETDQDIFLVTQREIGTAEPGEADLYEIGTVSHISHLLRMGSTVRCVVEGSQRAGAAAEADNALPPGQRGGRPRGDVLRGLPAQPPDRGPAAPDLHPLRGVRPDGRRRGRRGPLHRHGQPGSRLPGGLYRPEHQPAVHRQAGDPGGVSPYIGLRKLNAPGREYNVWVRARDGEQGPGVQLVRSQRSRSCEPRSGSSRTNGESERPRR